MAKPRASLWIGLGALAPAGLYALATDHGRPFMIANLFAAESDHSAVGLVLLALALVIGPLVAVTTGWHLRRYRRWAAVGLIIVACLLLALGLTTRQPFHQAWTLGPAAID